MKKYDCTANKSLKTIFLLIARYVTIPVTRRPRCDDVRKSLVGFKCLGGVDLIATSRFLVNIVYTVGNLFDVYIAVH